MNEPSLQDKKTIYQARRGLKELDLFIDPYVKSYFLQAEQQEKEAFRQLMACEDPDLLDWFMGKSEPDEALAALVKKIKQLKLGA